MDTILRTLAIYFILLIVMRLSGRRTLGEMNSFDLIVMLIIGGAVHRALLGQDYSVTNALLVVGTLVITDVALSLIQRDSPFIRKLLDGQPMIVVEDGRPLNARLRRARLTTSHVLEAARMRHGLESLDQVKFAILEASGEISVIPYRPHDQSAPGRALG